MDKNDLLTVGALAARAGTSVSAIRYYEAQGLVAALRTSGNQRRFLRADIRRVAFILIAQNLGLSLDDIAIELAHLPAQRTPTAKDWGEIGERIKCRIDARIAMLEKTRDLIGQCIGCGCLSLQRCQLYNRRDKAAQRGAGPRYLLGDGASEIAEIQG